MFVAAPASNGNYITRTRATGDLVVSLNNLRTLNLCADGIGRGDAGHFPPQIGILRILGIRVMVDLPGIGGGVLLSGACRVMGEG